MKISTDEGTKQFIKNTVSADLNKKFFNYIDI